MPTVYLRGGQYYYSCFTGTIIPVLFLISKQRIGEFKNIACISTSVRVSEPDLGHRGLASEFYSLIIMLPAVMFCKAIVLFPIHFTTETVYM